MKIRIKTAYSSNVTEDYGEALEEAGFKLSLKAGLFSIPESYIDNFEFEDMLLLVNTVKFGVIVNKENRDEPTSLTIYDGYLE